MTIIEYTDLAFSLFGFICIVTLLLVMLVVGVYGVAITLGSLYFDLARFFANSGKWK